MSVCYPAALGRVRKIVPRAVALAGVASQHTCQTGKSLWRKDFAHYERGTKPRKCTQSVLRLGFMHQTGACCVACPDDWFVPSEPEASNNARQLVGKQVQLMRKFRRLLHCPAAFFCHLRDAPNQLRRGLAGTLLHVQRSRVRAAPVLRLML